MSSRKEHIESAKMSSIRHASLLASASWALPPIVFIGLLGGLHPSDRLRDTVLIVMLSLVFLMNLPLMRREISSLRIDTTHRSVVLKLTMTALRLGFAVACALFIHGISHTAVAN